MRRVFGYCRVSGRDQGNHGTSLTAQQETISRHCKTRGLGTPDLRVEVDSGANESREQLTAIIAAAESGDSVLVTRVDRWSRDIVHAVRTVRDLVARGVSWVALDDNIDATTPSGDSMLGLMSWVADQERARIRDRTVGRRKQLRDAGCWVEGPVPYGFRRGDDRMLVVHDGEAAVIRELFQRCINGAPLTELATWAGAQGCKRDRAGVHKSLRRRWYIGQMRTSTGVWIDAHEPIVSLATFEAAQAALSKRRWHGRHGSSPRSEHWLLRGIADCSECGSRIGYAYSRRNDYYACNGRLRNRHSCSLPYIRVDTVDHDVGLLALERLVEVRDLLAMPPEAVTPSRCAEHIATLQRKRRRLVDMAADGLVAPQDLRSRAAAIDVELGALAALQAADDRRRAVAAPEAKAAMLGCVGALRRVWGRLRGEHQRTILEALSRRVVLYPGGARADWCDVSELSPLTYLSLQLQRAA